MQGVHPAHTRGSLPRLTQHLSLLPGLTPSSRHPGPWMTPGAWTTVPPSGQRSVSSSPPPPSRRHPGLGMPERTHTHVSHTHVHTRPHGLWRIAGRVLRAHLLGLSCGCSPRGSALPPASFCGRGTRVSKESGARPGLTSGSWTRDVFLAPPAHKLNEPPLQGGSHRRAPWWGGWGRALGTSDRRAELRGSAGEEVPACPSASCPDGAAVLGVYWAPRPRPAPPPSASPPCRLSGPLGCLQPPGESVGP